MGSMTLLGLAEIADLLNVTKQVVANWRARREDFPPPVVTLKSGPVWSFEAVRNWAESQGLKIVQPVTDSALGENTARHATVVSMMNMKGGVGKSTLAANLGWYGAIRRDLRVLLIDLDPQFNLSQYVLGVEAFENLLAQQQPTIEALFRQPIPGKPNPELSELIHVVNDWDDGSCLHLVPASLELAWSMRLALERAHVLRDGINEVKDLYDVVIIDCSPTESILSTAAYFASDFIVVPVRPEFLSTIGLPLLLRSLEEFKNTHKNEPAPDIAGIVFNDATEKVEHERSRTFVKRLAEEHSLPVFQHEVGHSDSYPAGARNGKPIFWTDNARETKKAEFARVASEFYQRIGK
jgi:chromosome partitioning protein